MSSGYAKILKIRFNLLKLLMEDHSSFLSYTVYIYIYLCVYIYIRCTFCHLFRKNVQADCKVLAFILRHTVDHYEGQFLGFWLTVNGSFLFLWLTVS